MLGTVTRIVRYVYAVGAYAVRPSGMSVDWPACRTGRLAIAPTNQRGLPIPYGTSMYLSRLELQGFKTFAHKTVLEFHPDASARRGLTGVVGPNGSGKSNIADALRWVMGEQSMKLLRSKKSEDVIFSGSAKKARAGFAEVSLTLTNDDRPDIDMSEIVVARRLYRDGQSEYEINKQSARLTDVALLLAQCGIGQRTYSVIGQGMVDAVLTASPAERREFFDEAAGLKQFQLKRNSSMNKLEGTRENLKQADVLLREIEPRLTSLERQVKRLKEREGLEQELKVIERAYFGRVWADLRSQLKITGGSIERAKAEYDTKNAEAAKLEQELAGMEKAAPVSTELRKLQESLNAFREDRSKLRERQITLESEQRVAAVKAQKPWSPLPLSKIIQEIDGLSKEHDTLFVLLESDKPDLNKVRSVTLKIKEKSADLLSKLQQTAPEETKAEPADPKLEKEFAALVKDMASIGEKIAETETRLAQLSAKEDESRAHLFQLQRELTAKRHEAQQAERSLSEATVEQARLETRRDGFYMELRTQAEALEPELEHLSDNLTPEAKAQAPEVLQSRMTKLRSQLEWIGGIDPETMKEYEETKARFESLMQQTSDLKEAMRSLEIIITELDKTIAERADVAFRQLDHEFGKFFQKLFGGGEAKILKVESEASEDEEGEVDEDREGREAGIEIQATPPGKRLKSIALLSGGERALTSIALICAIMAINPSPFVVLDEVDAALDEANSRKFAEIIDSLADRTQFVVVTHNRATMNKASVLYGVTMGEDGVSQLLSVKLAEYSTKNAEKAGA